MIWTMEGVIILVVLLIACFIILPRIPGLARYT
jgi:hypothetical protein